MTERDVTRVSKLLNRSAQGDRKVVGELFEIVQSELKAIAGGQMQRERPGHTLTPTALVNEAYLKLVAHTPERIENRKHFLAIAARAMRQVLVDYAERRAATKRGAGYALVTFEDSSQGTTCRAEEVLALNAALEKLHEADPRMGHIVEYHLFAGLEQAEVASLLDVSLSTVEREWRTARAWLKATLAKQ